MENTAETKVFLESADAFNHSMPLSVPSYQETKKYPFTSSPFFQLLVEGSPGDAEAAGGFTFIAFDGFQGFEDRGFFPVLPVTLRRTAPGEPPAVVPRGHPQRRSMAAPSHPGYSDRDRTTPRSMVFMSFPDITRPGVFQQAVHGLRGKTP